jgi:hypothetical protein
LVASLNDETLLAVGRDRHHAIVISSGMEDPAHEARAEALRVGCQATEIVVSERNAVYTFLIPPDGGYEGLGPSWDGDQRRDAVVEWLDSRNAELGELAPYTWCEVQYGDDEDDNRLLRSSQWERDGNTEP